MAFWVLISLGTIFEVVGDAFFKADKWIIGFISYTTGAGFWAYSLRFQSLSVAIIIFAILNVLLAVGVGHFYFHESLDTKQWIGLALGLGCIALLAT